MTGKKRRTRISTGNQYEVSVGYSRALKLDDHVYVAGTTALTGDGTLVGEDDPYAQTRQTLETIGWALEQAGATMDDIVRYRVYLTRIEDTPEVSRALAETFQSIRPANTLVAVAALADPRMLVEIDADAVIGSAEPVEDPV
jgi:enamine deaminase RidA (YjgF/YER057c/UK114 family)